MSDAVDDEQMEDSPSVGGAPPIVPEEPESIHNDNISLAPIPIVPADDDDASEDELVFQFPRSMKRSLRRLSPSPDAAEVEFDLMYPEGEDVAVS
jgi:hypothetical protein